MKELTPHQRAVVEWRKANQHIHARKTLREALRDDPNEPIVSITVRQGDVYRMGRPVWYLVVDRQRVGGGRQYLIPIDALAFDPERDQEPAPFVEPETEGT